MKHPIPAEALKESIAIVGRTGSGKSYAAKSAIERLLTAHARTCIIDPTGIWWGLRSSADGKSPGFPIIVFGGAHADVPISEQSGQPLAEMIATQNLPAIIDVAEFTMGARVRFMTAFLDYLYRTNRQPITLVVDEADLFAPQRALPDQTLMLSRMEQICRRGRVRGFRPWLITQRPAELHKSVLSQANTLIAMQLTAPQDRDAIGAWIEGQADRDEGKKLLAELPKLKRGEGFVWSPSHDVLARVQFPAITTFDSGRTPEEGETPPPVELASVDLSTISESLRAAEKDAQSNDPKMLRAEIAKLRCQLSARTVDAEALDTAYREGYANREAAYDTLKERVKAVGFATVESIKSSVGQLVALLDQLSSTDPLPDHPAQSEPKRVAVRDAIPTSPPRDPAVATAARHNGSGSTSSELPKGERAILTALAQYPGTGCTREQLSILTGYKRSSRDAYVQRLREKGFAETAGNTVCATWEGVNALGNFEPLPTGEALLQHWLTRLPSGESKILQLVVDKYPNAASRDWLSAKSGYKRSTRDAYIQRLRSRRLVDAREVVASGDLFDR